MHEVLSQFLPYVVGVWRRRGYVILVAWLVALAGWLVVSAMPDKFEASARVYVDTSSLLRPLLRGLVVENNESRKIDIMQRTLLSRPNLEKVARMTDMDLAAKTPTDMELLVDQLRAAITVRTEQRNLFSIRYTNADPQLAKRVVASLLSIYVESNLGSNRKNMDTASSFIAGQIRDYEKQLEAAEQRMAAFKRKYMGLLPGKGGYLQQLETARKALASARAELADAETKSGEMRRQLAAVPQFLKSDAVGSSGPPSDIQVRILEIQKNLDQLKLKYTDKFPDVVRARRRLAALKRELQAEIKSAAAAAGPSDESGKKPEAEAYGQPNPVYQQIKLQLVEAEATAATIKSRVKRHMAVVRSLQQRADRVPEIEAEYTKLTRDYGIIRKNYEQLLSRRESARMSKERDRNSDSVQFRVVDPPTVPLVPSGPPRALFLSVVLIAAIGAGIAFAFVLSTIYKTFFSADRLKVAFGLPVLGNVSMADLPGRRPWYATLRTAAFPVFVVALLGLYGGLMVVESRIGLNTLMSPGFAARLTGQLSSLRSR